MRRTPLLIGVLSLAMFLLGAQLLRAGLFAEEGRLLRQRLMVLGAVAAPVDLALGLTGSAAGLLAERYLVAPLVALGLLALLAELGLRRGSDGGLARRAREVGRVALSAYLLQTLLGGALFYGWGLGLAVSAAPWRVPVTIGVFVLIAAIVVLAAHLWLRRFDVGPVEWLWRRGEQLGSRPSR
ncbi:DUF418 domain-containing protein [Rathayibacter sp. VKM Ac-2929]|uniref:DUF418 domain-containing protein n=1 Tax=Rathayibacter sp. VKM Ac-2929 TaxID=2929480 RepID=UPI001FB4DB8A|nr:DUF418 domain-containing protein [Rathayibacter sp. VKM Ac-2929]MCJ1672715.1 DUF418 domain-containing protein [Rathayibacter sp. VKM Ac-2929]